jgi:hypothetical protein
MRTDQIIKDYFRILEYHGNYQTFEDFYSEHKSEIYESIVSIFEKFKSSSKNVLTINLRATIGSVFWNSDLAFTRDQFFILKRDILPFFEEEEDYEICCRIMKIYDELVSTT